jgi:hypothetical protein
MANQGLFTGGVKIRNLNGYLIAVNGEVFATTNTGGTTNAFFYKAKTTITSGDPTNGHLIWNNATQISATQLNVSHLTDTPVEDIDLFLSAIVSGNKLVVQDRDDSSNYQSWTVSGVPTQVGSAYWTIPVTFLESSGTGTTGFANNHNLLFAIISGGAGGGITTNAVTFNNSGSGAASGTSFNGATPVTVSYNTFGAQQASASLSSLAALSYASGTPFVKMTAAGTFALDTNTYLTANQTITLSGDGSGSGTTAITLTLATVNSNVGTFNNVTVNAKGLVTSASNVSYQTLNANLTSLAGLTFASTSFVKMTGANTFSLDTNTYLTANQTITLSGDVGGSGTTTITTTIGNNAITLAKFQQISTASFLGRVTASTGNVEVLTGTQATTLLDSFAGSIKGLVPVSVGGTTNFLRADGTWAAPPGGTTTNAVTFNNSGSGAASGTTFDGSVARTISYNTIGANKVITSGTSAPTGGVDGDIYLQTDVSVLTGSGTTNYIPKFTSATAIGNSQIFDNGTSVGINTTSPIGKFSIVGTSTGVLDFNTDATRCEIQSYNKPLAINRQGNNTLLNEGGGFVGIGTASPGAKLEVNGTGIFSSDVSTATGDIAIGRDLTYSTPYMSVGFGGRLDANNKIYGARDATDGLFLNAATGRGISMVVNGGATTAMRIASGGAATFNSSVTVSTNLTAAQYKLSALNTAPATASSSGTLGEIIIDATAIYICTATNTWKRALITTF